MSYSRLRKYMRYEMTSMYFEDIGCEEMEEEYLEKGCNIWYKLSDKEQNLLRSRGFINSFDILAIKNRKILEKLGVCN